MPRLPARYARSILLPGIAVTLVVAAASFLSITGAVAATSPLPQTPAPPQTADNACVGRSAPETTDRAQVAYSFHCRSPITSYTVISSRSIAGFEVNAEVTDRATGQPSNDDKAQCEGPFPGDGFNCTGSVQGRNKISSTFEPETAACSRKGRWSERVQIVVASSTGVTSGPFTLTAPLRCPAVRQRTRPRQHS